MTATQQNNDLARIQERIRRCLAIADNDASADGEIEAALRVATSLMAKHNLDREDCIDAGGNVRSGRVEFGRFEVHSLAAKRIYWELALLNFIIRLIPSVSSYSESKPVLRRDARGIVETSGGKPVKCKKFYFYGPDDDAEFASQLFTELQLSIFGSAKLKFGSFARGDGATYAEGYISGLADAHIKEVARLTNGDSQTRALTVRSTAVAKALQQEGTSWLAKTHDVKLRKGSGLSGSNGAYSARNEGLRDGRNTSLPGRRQPVRRIG